jgi:hypothetical protein
MISKKKIVAMIIVVLAAASLVYFYFEGEKEKQEVIYFAEGGNEGMAVIIEVPLVTAYRIGNPDLTEQEINEAFKPCVSSAELCVEKFSPNLEIKQSCLSAVKSIKAFTQNIKNENSVLLGLNLTILNIQLAFCPEITTKEELLTSNSCMDKIDLYGSKKAQEETDACFQRINEYAKSKE